MQYIKGFDTLRAFAVMLIIIAHYGIWFDATVLNGHIIKDILIPDGGFGVDLFFVLSGFLITSILLNAKHAAASTRPGTIIKQFYLRRALRIFPIYYLLIIFLYAINYPEARDQIIYYATYSLNAFCYNRNHWTMFSHTCSLDVEEQFYLIWPCLIILVKDKYLKYVFSLFIAIGIISTYNTLDLQHHFATIMLYNCLNAFAIGGIYAWVRVGNYDMQKFRRIVNILAVAAFACYMYWKIGAFIHVPVLYGMFLLRTVNSILALWLMLRIVNNSSAWVGRYILGNRFLNYIGRISYGIYLYHFVYLNYYCGKLGDFIDHATKSYPDVNTFVMDHHFNYWLNVAVMIGIAAVSYELIEKPILRFKHRFDYRPAQKIV